MNANLNQLESVIQNEMTLGKKFLTLLRLKKEAIISNNIDDVDSLTKEENEAIGQMEEIGYHRQDMVLSISTESRELRMTESLRDLVKQLPKNILGKFTELRTQLLSLYQDISTESKLNGELLAQSISITQHLFNRYSSIDKRVRHGNYGTQGYAKKGQGSTVFHKEG